MPISSEAARLRFAALPSSVSSPWRRSGRSGTRTPARQLSGCAKARRTSISSWPFRVVDDAVASGCTLCHASGSGGPERSARLRGTSDLAWIKSRTITAFAFSTNTMKRPPKRQKRKSSGRFGSTSYRQLRETTVPEAIPVQRSTRSCSYAAACRGPNVSSIQRAISVSDASAWRVRRQGLDIVSACVPRRKRGGSHAHRLPRQGPRILPDSTHWPTVHAVPSIRPLPAQSAAIQHAKLHWHSDSGRKKPADPPVSIACRSKRRFSWSWPNPQERRLAIYANLLQSFIPIEFASGLRPSASNRSGVLNTSLTTCLNTLQ